MELRYYQQDAVNAVYEHLRTRTDNPCVVIPTGGGKTPVIATLIKDSVLKWHGRVLLLAHVKELLEQAADKLTVMAPELLNRTGIYSAGLGSKDADGDVVIAGIQSIFRHACEVGKFDLVVIDEAHLIPPDGEGMYRQFLQDAKTVNPNVRMIGLTATPYRMSSGEICEDGNLLNHICYEIGVKELIVKGYLSPLVSKAAKGEVDTGNLHVRGGEFINTEVAALMDNDAVIRQAVGEIGEYTASRRSILIFCASVEHMRHVAELLQAQAPGAVIRTVSGETGAAERAENLEQFKAGGIKYLLNVNVLTTGFDAPNVDCVALLRPTHSPGLYYQMVGRGFRRSPGKENCLILDFGGNIMRHGPVDMLEAEQRRHRGDRDREPGPPAVKKCPKCNSVIHVCYQICPDCGYEFPKVTVVPHDGKATTAGIISGQVSYVEYPVYKTLFSEHEKYSDPSAPPTVQVDYEIGFNRFQSEWVCPQHTGYARDKFVRWWKERSKAPVPNDVITALVFIREGALAPVKKITVKTVTGDKFDRVTGYEFGPIPEFTPEPGWNDAILDSIPANPVPAKRGSGILAAMRTGHGENNIQDSASTPLKKYDSAFNIDMSENDIPF